MATASSDIVRLYLRVHNRDETVEWPKASTTEEIKSVLLTAADVPSTLTKDVVLKLTQQNGCLVSIGPKLTSNTPHTRYTLQVVSEKLKSGAEDSVNPDELVNTVAKLKGQIDSVSQVAKLAHPHKGPNAMVRRAPNIDPRYADRAKYVFTEETKEYLKQCSFDNWQWEENEALALLELMFDDMGLIEEFKIDVATLKRFLRGIKDNYNANPFHNFKHCFCVTQMMYGIIHTTEIVHKLKPIDKLVLLISCIGHDLDHPGYNNAYQINAKTDLAIIYNDTSPLENHHAAVLFTLLRAPETNILSNVPDAVFREIRKGTIRCILATDMAKHGEIMTAFKKHVDNFNIEDQDQRNLLVQMIIKCADISNEVRPTEVAEPWVDCLLEEFFAQSDREKAEGLPTAPFMDREKVTKAGAQVGFIGFVMIPLYELTAKVLPNMEAAIIQPIRQSLTYYKEMLEKTEGKK
ncbi:cGMP phosphodiesterase [Polychytrium aggregatum]|uniref:cGMP phosphodiesterase n=1 Tax=Polychytrium aggregatum TaxID=110093 RepID=UPI0022FE1931|nr:cGMP phosphodiesterase [Polychytrium aggregatum]KAI9202505.1 cGMP phosphodiesterase [Polychytrium aggregatum]